MEENLLQQTIDRIPEWTHGHFDANRIFYSKANQYCVIVRPFICEHGNRELLQMAEEGYVPHGVWLFFDTDLHKLAQTVRRHVIFTIKIRENYVQEQDA